MRSRFRLCLPIGAICLSSVVAHASDQPVEYPVCKSKPTASDRKGAKGAFAAGEASFKEADYATAIVYWHDAYRRDCTAHALLRNLATAYELLGDRKAAIHALETYLERNPKDPEAAAIQRRIDNLKEQLSATSSPPPAPTPSEPESSTLIPRPMPVVQAPPVQPAEPEEPEPAPVTESRSILPWVTVGVGGAATIAGTVVFFDGRKKVADAEEVCPTRRCSADIANKGNAGRREQTIGLIVGGVGLAAVAGGVVWGLMFNEPTTVVTETGIAPQVGPDFAGVQFAGRF